MQNIEKGVYTWDGGKWILNDVSANNGLSISGKTIQLGGDLTKATAITGTNTLSIETPLKITSGTPGSNKILVSDATGNASWVDINTLSGKFFYLPSFDLDISSIGDKEKNLYTDVYVKQFTRSGNSNFISSGENTIAQVSTILDADRLDFIVTDYSSDVIKINSISAAGLMDYEVLTVNGAGAYVNIVLRVK